MSEFKEKYGAWGIIFGATDGVGKAMAKFLAERKLNVVLVGRRTAALDELGKGLAEEYQVEYQVVTEDLSTNQAIERIIEQTKELDIGFVSYVACLSVFGPFSEHTWEDEEKMLQINIVSFTKYFHYYTKLFKEKNRGGIINIGSMSGLTGSPYIAQYGAGKSFIIKMTEAVGFEMLDTNVDIMVPILGSTITPSFLQSLPDTEAGKAALAAAMTPEECMDEIFENFGKTRSMILGDLNRKNAKEMAGQPSDQTIEFVGNLFK
ncbi:7beta-hydroxysteroid dehydrogenase [Candidatus Enterococcus ikei]|uniref:SDR family NAD(P)-dependent oxidoreductase n=1 Tax=Candidatus Enterococcus ikei TaxID=2815326 RepID=A0ABS3H1K5_9ENTE|nr:SDR family NAD(P)-dependent oxidoreductase [Enterococcus sp. DIV0869a]MBO0441038.1 SDR family NAD(P)-dependent oxidoreductase [Enterococcus sp. DIV0869a]